jgi:hypothetical protein
VLAAAATGVADFIEDQGGDIDSIFGNAGIPPEHGGRAHDEAAARLLLQAVFEEASKRVGSRRFHAGNFGLWFGQQFQPRDLGMWGYAAISAPTLAASLENLVRLFHFHQESSWMRLRRGDGGLIRLEYQIYSSEIVERRQDAELSLGHVRQCDPRMRRAESGRRRRFILSIPRPECWADHRGRLRRASLFQPADQRAAVPARDAATRGCPARDLQLMSVMETCLGIARIEPPER